MRIKNTETRYGMIAVVIHWIMALIIIGLVIVGLYMVRLSISEFKLRLFGIHKEFGVLILMLVMFRLVWRLGNISPMLPAAMPQWQKFLAHAVHWAFYGFMIALPLTGLSISFSADLPVSFFGLFLVPSFLAPNHDHQMLFAEIHKWLAYGLIATFFAHVGAALKHHFINKDDTLRRMLSW